MQPKKTRKIRIGKLIIGGDSPIAVQSMAATQTQDLDATARQIEVLEKAKADVIRIAVDNEKRVLTQQRQGFHDTPSGFQKFIRLVGNHDFNICPSCDVLFN